MKVEKTFFEKNRFLTAFGMTCRDGWLMGGCGGVKKFYASPVHGKEITLEAITKSIEKTSTVNGADIRAVLYKL